MSSYIKMEYRVITRFGVVRKYTNASLANIAAANTTARGESCVVELISVISDDGVSLEEILFKRCFNIARYN